MAYCSSEQKFAGFEEPTVEVDSEDVADGELQVTVRVVRCCTGCGQEQAELNLEFATAFEHECPDERGDVEDDWVPKNGEPVEERTYEIDGSVDAEPLDEYQRTDRHGKPIKSMRYQKHLIGAQITATVTCSRCGESIEISESQTESASSFEDQGSH